MRKRSAIWKDVFDQHTYRDEIQHIILTEIEMNNRLACLGTSGREIDKLFAQPDGFIPLLRGRHRLQDSTHWIETAIGQHPGPGQSKLICETLQQWML
jgi:hypothetical protein